MDIQNHYYGHSAVLAAYCGLPRPRHMSGLLQHGWTLVSPLPVHFGDFPRVGRRPDHRRLLVWSHRSRAWDPTAADRPTTAIGSPFLYLERTLRQQGWSPSTDGGPVFVPFHGTRLVRIRGDHKKLARQVAEADGPSTVCLHADDCSDPDLLDAWASAGHHLVTAGERNDPWFLPRIMHLVGTASRVSSNRLSTALMYAAALGKPVRVHGDPLVPGVQEATSLEEVERRWPEFHCESAPDDLRTIARDELGEHGLLSPAPLRDVLGWAGRWSAGPAFDYWVGSPIAKAGMVVGLTRRTEGSTVSLPDAGPLQFLRHPLSHLPNPLPRGLDQPVATTAPLPVPTPRI
ncbi:hypothetical protein [Pseudonocardia sp. H11422]|uniref:hypothetical protein n=1 Tax=Pseudonocardia sp. H11422 TaxID=2835866 RepID=UPI001BDC2508|nr:hypothetical protein [Pseudonocardia sp. H11422]